MAQKIGILIVDNDTDLCKYLQAFFTGEGYRVKSIQCSVKALEELGRHHYHIVILDLEMPTIDREPILKKIRRVDSDICVIALTASPSVESAVEAMKGGAFGYLKKPLNASELHEVVLNAIREKGLITDLEDRLNMEIGRRLRRLRQERQLNLRQLATRTGLSVSLISQIELGKTAASLSTLYKIVTALGVTFSTFFEEMKKLG